MNIHLIDIFETPEDLIQVVIKYIKENINDFSTLQKTTTEKSINFTYRNFKLDKYPDDYIGITIYGIYQKGIIIRIMAHSDLGFYKYDNITSGLLIIKENENPKLIIDAIDGRIEHNKVLTNTNQSKLFINVNQHEIQLEIDKLGKRIDHNYVGKIKKNIYYNEKKHQEKIDIIKEKIKILILKHIQQLEYSKKTSVIPIKKQRTKYIKKRRHRNMK